MTTGASDDEHAAAASVDLAAGVVVGHASELAPAAAAEPAVEPGVEVAVAPAGSVLAAVAALSAAVAGLAGSSWAGLDDQAALAVVRQVETARRQLEAYDAPLVAEIEARGLPAKHVHRSTARWLSAVLNLSAAEAARRVGHAHALGERRALTGQPLPPLHPALAAARAQGSVTAEHVQVVLRTLDRLPSATPVDTAAEAEAYLTDQARRWAPRDVAGLGRALLDALDPDGALADEADIQRRRYLSIQPLGDGMVRILGDLDTQTGNLALTVLNALAAPKPATDLGHGRSVPDPRTAGQRLHDALRAGLKKLLHAGSLPMTGGLPATVLITMTADQYETKTGLAVTSHGHKIRVGEALRHADQALIGWLVHDSHQAVLAYGEKRRIASAQQTRALIARDRGCAFPGCQDPPEWTERHHITPWRDTPDTSINNLCLLCDHHHDRIDTEGWTITTHHGIPWFTPPPHIDPTRTPQRNHRP
ncbi:DUF222 domain-containing protein [Jatrophihabitans sp. DSM 45814]